MSTIATFLLCTISLLLASPARAQCVTALAAPRSCATPSGATAITDGGGGNTNVNIAGGTYVYSGAAGIQNLNLAGGTLYYTSNGTLNGANISGGTIIYTGTGAANNVNQSGGTVQVCNGGQLSLTGNLNAGTFVVASGGQLTFPNTFTLQNSSLLTNYGKVVFQGSLTIASGTTGAFVNAGILTASGQVFLNGPGFVNQGIANFGTLVINGSGRACLGPRSVLNVNNYQTNDNTNSLTVSPSNGALACVRVTTNGTFNNIVATAVPSALGICRAGTVSAADLARYGTAQVTPNCTNCSTVLPVQLVSFSATAQPGAVALAWRTASEVNSARFEVERSADGQVFRRLGEVLAAGNTLVARAYHYTDANPLAGTAYYRLRSVDLDGRSAYSPAQVVTAAASSLTLFPNPTHATCTLAGASAKAPVQVLDALGQVLVTTATDADGSATLTTLLPGLYVVRCAGQTRRLAVE